MFFRPESKSVNNESDVPIQKDKTTKVPTTDPLYYERLIPNYNEEEDIKSLDDAKSLTVSHKTFKASDEHLARVEASLIQCYALKAAEKGLIKTFKYFCEEKVFNPNDVGGDLIAVGLSIERRTHFFTALAKAISAKQKGIALYILDNFSLEKASLDFTNRILRDWRTDFYGSPLSLAIDQGDGELVNRLLQKGATPVVRWQPKPWKGTGKITENVVYETHPTEHYEYGMRVGSNLGDYTAQDYVKSKDFDFSIRHNLLKIIAKYPANDQQATTSHCLVM